MVRRTGTVALAGAGAGPTPGMSRRPRGCQHSPLSITLAAVYVTARPARPGPEAPLGPLLAGSGWPTPAPAIASPTVWAAWPRRPRCHRISWPQRQQRLPPLPHCPANPHHRLSLRQGRFGLPQPADDLSRVRVEAPPRPLHTTQIPTLRMNQLQGGRSAAPPHVAGLELGQKDLALANLGQPILNRLHLMHQNLPP